MSRRSSLNISRTASPLGPSSSSRLAASSTPIVVDVSFDSPVVFAGQALTAKITFRNPEPPIPAPDHQPPPPTSTSANLSDQGLGNHTQLAQAPISSNSSRDFNNHNNHTNDDSQWDIPGRKLSVQIASTFRDLYFNNSASSPELPAGSVHPHSPARTTAATGISNSGLHRSGSVRASPPQHSVATPSLLMGYAQVQGYFVVDDELVDVSQFAHAKTQGVVVGASGLAYAPAPQTGFLHGLASGIGSLFQVKDAEAMNSRVSPVGNLPGRVRAGSFGNNGLTRSPVMTPIGGNNMRSGATTPTAQGTSSAIALSNTGPAPANAVPIFSTPQSLLFVDLKLAPGEKRVFYYKLPLPKTLPPSCRAKSLRIHYNLVIGTQKLIRGMPVPKTTFVPFRVFPYIDKYGLQYTHDLKAPIVLQRDDALVASIPLDIISSEEATAAYITKLEATSTKNNDSKRGNRGNNTRHDFELYVAEMLREINAHKDQNSSQITSSPNEKHPNIKPPESPVAPLFSQVMQSSATISDDDDPRNNIEHFTRFQQTKPPARPLKTRYDIGRAGRRIAAITFSKAVYRVGDSVLFTVDFARAALKCFHVTVALETEEAISPDVLKQFNENTDDDDDDDNNDLSRQQKQLPVVDTSGLTRRVYSQATTSTYAAAKTAFEFTIPATATPQFSTSAIALKWVLKMDFITSPAAAPPMVSELIGNSNSNSNHERTTSTSELSADQQSPTPNYHDQAEASGNSNQQPPSEHATASARTFVPEDILEHIPDDPHSVMEIVSVSPKGVIAVAKETIACEAFSCKVPLHVVPTNQDISALLRHSVLSTRSWEL
ncbi:uncharacterized protein SAPINGB_P006050 [Magnusiomyces paraingens]|uniref:Rgp1-domain-containing protein n=1 Tax=Magnusiomyces paraingens TaxID=2606893 RepID=A0A5E8CA60_9ASCO|nr:uncharacterized protein SAPINGB_P006050 [Saprochaete ingens]VVT58126.1 unnamed protein product [Saprochaete ingens]